MKNLKLPFFGLALVLTVAACRKEDVKLTEKSTTPTVEVTKAFQWKSLNNWSSATANNTPTYFSKMSDSSITADVTSAGLVLVYKKSGNNIQSLPLQDDKTYWYYQVSKGSIRINSDNNSGENLTSQSFSYFIITPQKLSELESSGKTRVDLMQLSYNDAAALLK